MDTTRFMKYNIFILLALLSFSASCQSQDRPDLPAVYKTKGMIPYAHDDRSDSLGNPRDSLAFYIPPEAVFMNWEGYSFTDRKNNLHVVLDHSVTKTQLAEQYRIDRNSITDTNVLVLDTFKSRRLSYNFYKIKEPVLSNYYLSDTIYRVTYLSEGLGPISMRIIKGNRPVIVTKMLEAPLDIPHRAPIYDMSQGGKEVHLEPFPYSIRTDTMSPLEPGALREIDSLFAQVDFKEMPYNTECYEGPYTIYEMQTKEGYYFFVQCLRGRSSIYSKILDTLMKYSDLDKPTKNMFLSD